ncbi:MAG: MarR family transcriptional regulator [Thiolinea sp.]
MPPFKTLEELRQAGVENQLGFLTTSFSHMARQYLLNQLQQRGQDAGLKIDELPVMARLFEQPGLPQAELNRLTFKDKATVTRLLAALEKKQLIIRRIDEEDRRARKIYLSPQGEQLIRNFVPIAQTMQQTLFEGIPESDIQTTQRIMKLLYQRIAEQTERNQT